MIDYQLAITSQDFIFGVKGQQEQVTINYFSLGGLYELSFGTLLEDKHKTSTDFAPFGSILLFPGLHTESVLSEALLTSLQLGRARTFGLFKIFFHKKTHWEVVRLFLLEGIFSTSS